MFKIGEFSKLTQVSVRMLRYYDETGLLKPAKVDSCNGYRLYSVDQIGILNKIIYLRDSGFQVAEIAAAINRGDDNDIIDLLDNKSREITTYIQAEQVKLKKLKIAKHALQHEKSSLHYNITIKAIPRYLVLSLRKIIPNYYAEGGMWMELSEFAKTQKIETTSETFSIYHDLDYREENVDVELCIVVKKVGLDIGNFKFYRTDSVPVMACTMVCGDFTNIAGAYLSFAKWLQVHSQYKMSGANRQIVHRGPWNEGEPKNYLTEIQIPLSNPL